MTGLRAGLNPDVACAAALACGVTAHAASTTSSRKRLRTWGTARQRTHQLGARVDRDRTQFQAVMWVGRLWPLRPAVARRSGEKGRNGAWRLNAPQWVSRRP